MKKIIIPLFLLIASSLSAGYVDGRMVTWILRATVSNYNGLYVSPFTSYSFAHTNDFVLAKKKVATYPAGVYQHFSWGWHLFMELPSTNITRLLESGVLTNKGTTSTNYVNARITQISNFTVLKFTALSNHTWNATNGFGSRFVSYSNRMTSISNKGTIQTNGYGTRFVNYSNRMTWISNRIQRTNGLGARMTGISNAIDYTNGLGSRITGVSNGVTRSLTNWTKTYTGRFTVTSNWVTNLVNGQGRANSNYTRSATNVLATNIYRYVNIVSNEIVVFTTNFTIGKISAFSNFSFNETPGLCYTYINGGTEFSVSSSNNYLTGRVIIPKEHNGLPVTVIQDYAFANKDAITSIFIPDSIVKIGLNAFDSCLGLSTVFIPYSVVDLKESIFNNCQGLRSVTLPNGITNVPKNMFATCVSLDSIFLPNEVLHISESAFNYCRNLEEIFIPYGVESIDDYAFINCAKLKRVEIPASVTSLGVYAFYNCLNLSRVNMTSEVPAELKSDFTGTNVFKNTASDLRIYVPSVNAVYTYKTNWYTMQTNIVAYLSTLPKELYFLDEKTAVVSNDVFVIEDADALHVKKKVKYSSIMAGVTNFTFTRLASVSNRITAVSNLLGSKLSRLSNNSWNASVRATNGMFQRFVNYSNRMTGISNRIQYTNGLGARITSVSNAIGSTNGIGGRISSASNGAVSLVLGIDYLQDLIFGTNTVLRGLISDVMSSNLSYLLSGKEYLVYDYAYANTNSHISIPGNHNGLPVTEIRPYGFYAHQYLKTITIPDSVSKVDVSAFGFSTNLIGCNLSEGLQTIGDSAFYYCFALRGINIPSSVNRIDSGAFSFCTSLRDISLLRIGSIEQFTFLGCTALKSISLTEGLTNIGSSAFNGCTSLKEITIPKTVKNIATYAFLDSVQLTNIYMKGMIAPTLGYAYTNYVYDTNLIIVGTNVLWDNQVFNNIRTNFRVIVPNKLALINYKTNDSWATFTNHLFSANEEMDSMNIALSNRATWISNDLSLAYGQTNGLGQRFLNMSNRITGVSNSLAMSYGQTNGMGQRFLDISNRITGVSNGVFSGVTNWTRNYSSVFATNSKVTNMIAKQGRMSSNFTRQATNGLSGVVANHINIASNQSFASGTNWTRAFVPPLSSNASTNFVNGKVTQLSNVLKFSFGQTNGFGTKFVNVSNRISSTSNRTTGVSNSVNPKITQLSNSLVTSLTQWTKDHSISWSSNSSTNYTKLKITALSNSLTNIIHVHGSMNSNNTIAKVTGLSNAIIAGDYLQDIIFATNTKVTNWNHLTGIRSTNFTKSATNAMRGVDYLQDLKYMTNSVGKAWVTNDGLNIKGSIRGLGTNFIGKGENTDKYIYAVRTNGTGVLKYGINREQVVNFYYTNAPDTVTRKLQTNYKTNNRWCASSDATNCYPLANWVIQNEITVVTQMADNPRNWLSSDFLCNNTGGNGTYTNLYAKGFMKITGDDSYFAEIQNAYSTFGVLKVFSDVATTVWTRVGAARFRMFVRYGYVTTPGADIGYAVSHGYYTGASTNTNVTISRKNSDGTTTVLGRGYASMNTNREECITAIAVGSNIVAYVDGKKVVSVYDTVYTLGGLSYTWDRQRALSTRSYLRRIETYRPLFFRRDW